MQNIIDNQRNQLFGEVVWSIVVAASCDIDGQVVGVIVGECDKVGTRLRCRVGRAGRQLLLFGEELSAECGDVVTPFHHALHIVGKV